MVVSTAFKAASIGDLVTLQTITNLNDRLVDDEGACCLHYAARGGSVPVIEYLIGVLKFSPLARSRAGATAMHDAAAKGNTAVVKWLVEQGEIKVDDQDGSGLTACHLAARYGHILTVEWLLDEADADITVRSSAGALPLHFAVFGGDMNCVKILLDENPRLVNMQMNNGATPIYLACQCGHLEVVEYLASRNAATKIKAYDGMSCLHAAAQMGHLPVVKWLVQVDKSNPNDRDFDGSTPLHYAASRGYADMVKWLMKEGGAKVTLDNLGGSPLHNAAELGELKCVQALIESGCDLTLTDNEGLTAAELAEKCLQPEAVALIAGDTTVLDDLSDDESYLPPQPDRSELFGSPQLNFPPPPPFPPEDDQEVQAVLTVNTATNTSFTTDHKYSNGYGNKYITNNNIDTGGEISFFPGSYINHTSPESPPLPPPPTSFSPDASTPSTVGSPISPPTPIIEDDYDIVTHLHSVKNARNSVSRLSQEFTGPLIQRTISRVSVDSSASNFGVFEIQEGPVVQTVKAEVHRIPATVPPTPQPFSSSENLYTRGWKSSSTITTGSSTSNLTGSSTSYTYQSSSPAVNSINGLQNKQSNSSPISPPYPSTPSSPRKDSLLSDTSTSTSSSKAQDSSGYSSSNITRQSSAQKEKSTRSPANRYLQDINTGTRSNFAKAKALFAQIDSTGVNPDTGEFIHQGKKPPPPVSRPKMATRIPTPPPPPPPEELSSTGGNDSTESAQQKSVITITSGKVTVISTKSKSPAHTHHHKHSVEVTPINPRPSELKTSSNLIKTLSEQIKASADHKAAQSSINVVKETTNSVSSSQPKDEAVTKNGSVSPGAPKQNGDAGSGQDFSRQSSSSSVNSQPFSPVEMKNNLIADIQSAVSGTSNLSLRRAKSRGEGVSMVFQSSKAKANNGTSQTEPTDNYKPLSGDFDPKNFLDKVEKVDSTGRPIPEWRRQVLAKHMAEKAQKEFEEKKQVDDYEARFRGMPAWKRALIERKEAQAREEEKAAAGKKY